MPVPHLPADRLRRLTPANVAMLAVALPPLAVLAVSLGDDGTWTYAPAISAVATVVTVSAQLWAARFATRFVSAMGVVIVGTPFLAAACAGALNYAWGLQWSPTEAYRWGWTMAVVGFFVVGLPVGLWQGALAWMAHAELQKPSHEARDRILVRLGLLLAGPAAALGALGIAFTNVSPQMLVAWIATLVLAPVLVVAWAVMRLHARRRWLAAVVERRVAGWRVVDWTAEARNLVPLVTQGKRESKRVRVLVQTESPREPFRQPEQHQPFALVLDDDQPFPVAFR